jgi:hypothetical protein
MTIPSFILGLLIAAIMGVIFHAWRGGRLFRLLLYIALSEIGFWLGNLFGHFLSWEIVKIGPLYLGPAIIGAIGVLGAGYWLSLVNGEQHQS